MQFEEEIISDIRSKKELRALDEDFISKKIEEFLKDTRNNQAKSQAVDKLNKSLTYKQFSKSREHDFLVKGIRAELRKVYGAFILEEYKKKEALLKNLKIEDIESHIRLLRLHKSTLERLPHYEALYKAIFNDNDLPDKLIVMDLACGLNPISSIYFRDRLKKYIASDISNDDCNFLEKYFEKTKIPHDVFAMDLADESNYATLARKKCDVCFVFKALDGIERVQRDITEKLLEAIDAKIIAITFPTLTLSGHREIKEHRRLWLERILDKLHFEWEKILVDNELLYIVKNP